MSPMTSTTFAGGINESLAAIDIFAQSGELFSGVNELVLTQSNLGSLADAIAPVALNAVSTIPGASAIAASATAVLPPLLSTNIFGEATINPAGVLANASEVASGAYSAIQSATGQIKQALTAVDSIKSQITTTIAGVTSTITQMAAGNVNTLFNATKGLIDPSITAQMKDIGAITTLGANVAKQAVSGGMGGAFTALSLSPQFQGSPLKAITGSILPVIKAVGNIKAFIEVAKQKGPALLSASLAPALGIDVLATFNATKNGIKKTKAALVGQWNQFKNAATSIKNSFFTAKKNIKTLFSAKGLKKLSTDAKKMLKSSVDQATTQASAKMASQTPAQLVASIKQIPIPSMEQTIFPTLIAAPKLAISTVVIPANVQSMFA